MRPLLSLTLLLVPLNGLVDVDFEPFDLFSETLALFLQLSNLILHVVFALLSHKSLAHTVSDGAFIEGLVGLDRHFDLVADTH